MCEKWAGSVLFRRHEKLWKLFRYWIIRIKRLLWLLSLNSFIKKVSILGNKVQRNQKSDFISQNTDLKCQNNSFLLLLFSSGNRLPYEMTIHINNSVNSLFLGQELYIRCTIRFIPQMDVFMHLELCYTAWNVILENP